jgi:hypothetical protein
VSVSTMQVFVRRSRSVFVVFIRSLKSIRIVLNILEDECRFVGLGVFGPSRVSGGMVHLWGNGTHDNTRLRGLLTHARR